ncbi:unnamed protein product [Ectocarpus sp. CCAP 1310/34]|nr:unnamed protein product [Ectocarpus sp. CCAP 1310/34]
MLSGGFPAGVRDLGALITSDVGLIERQGSVDRSEDDGTGPALVVGGSPIFSEGKTVAESEPSVYSLKGEQVGSDKGTAKNAPPQLQQILPLLLTFLDSRSWCVCLAVSSAARDAVRALFSGLMTVGPRPEERWTVPLDVLTLKTDGAGIAHMAANECNITIHGSAGDLAHLKAVIVPPPQSGFITVKGEQYIATSPILRCRWTGNDCSQGPWTVSFPLEEEDGLSNPTELSRVLRRGDELWDEWEVQTAGLKASLRHTSMQVEVTHFSDVVTADKLREIEEKWAKSYYERKRWWGAPSFSRHAHVYNASSEEMTVLQELPPRMDAERGVQIPTPHGGGGMNRAYTTPDGNARERALLPPWPNANGGDGNDPPIISARFRTLPGAGEMCVVPYTVRVDPEHNLRVFPRDFFRCLAGYDYYLLQKMLDVRARYRERDVKDLNEEETVIHEVKPRR